MLRPAAPRPSPLVIAAWMAMSAAPTLAQEGPAPSEVALPAVRVREAPETATGPVPGYVAKRTATATKTDVPLIEVPQSISIVPAEQIQTLKPQNLVEALGYTAGVGRDEGADRTGDGFTLRGFGASAYFGSVYRDGSKYQVNFYNGQQEPYGLERVEVLKGASSVLYGAVAPGGVINTISKRPTANPIRELNVEVGSWDRKQVSGDFAGALSADGAWTYRLTGLVRDADSFVDHVEDDRFFVAPALQWQPNAATSFTLLSEFQHDKTTYVYGLPADGTINAGANPNGRIPRNRFVGEPGYDKYDNKRYSVGYLFEHAFDDTVKLRHSLRYLNASNTFPSVWIWGIDPADHRTTVDRGAQDRWDNSDSVTTDTSLQFKFGTGGVAHAALVGLDYTQQKNVSERYDRDGAPLDLYDPVYGGGLSDVTASHLWDTRSKRLGLYVQDQVKFDDRWVVLAGLRQDWVRYSESENAVGAPTEWSAKDEKSDALTGRLGVVYLAGGGLAPYASYAQSFEPVAGSTFDGARFKPTRGEQVEVGVRYMPEGRGLMLSAAVFELTQDNVTATDPLNPGYSLPIGKVRSRGIELEARGRVAPNTEVIAAYAYTDARVVETSPATPELLGRRNGGSPYNQLSVWADYSFGAIGLPGLKAGAGVRYVDDTRATWIEGVVPSYTLVDLMASYTTGPWRFALNVNNAGDRAYFSCTYDCFYGEPRRVIGTATYRW
ncbi:MAG: TonB-dependent siderophore receptor [Rhizobacter sp.]